jgi:hypothetical protein
MVARLTAHMFPYGSMQTLTGLVKDGERKSASKMWPTDDHTVLVRLSVANIDIAINGSENF